MYDSAWQNTKEYLSNTLDGNTFAMWVLPLEFHTGDASGTVILKAPNQYIINHITPELLSQISVTLSEFGVTKPEVSLIVDPERLAADNQPTKSHNRKPSGEEFLSNQLNTDLIFANHVEGKSNQIARASARRVAETPGRIFNPLFIYGKTGLGKTHLMHAIGNEILAKHPNSRVVYISAENFVNLMISAIKDSNSSKRMDQFKNYFRSIDTFLLDDVQFFAAKEHSQEELFHTFNSLLQSNKQIILASDRHPTELDNIEDRLKSRFSGGLSVQVEPPEIETRVAILMKKAELLGIELASETAFFIAGCVQSNVRDLEGALNNCIATSLFHNNKIDLAVAKEALSDRIRYKEHKINISNIQKVVAEYYRIKLSDLLSNRRDRKIARPRQVAMFLAKELTSKSLPEIGREFSGRDHTTVIHAVKTIKKLSDSDASMDEDITNLRNLLT